MNKRNKSPKERVERCLEKIGRILSEEGVSIEIENNDKANIKLYFECKIGGATYREVLHKGNEKYIYLDEEDFGG